MRKIFALISVTILFIYSITIWYSDSFKWSIEDTYGINIESEKIYKEINSDARSYLLSNNKYNSLVWKVDSLMEKIQSDKGKMVKLYKSIQKTESKYKDNILVSNILDYLKSSIMIEIYNQITLDYLEVILEWWDESTVKNKINSDDHARGEELTRKWNYAFDTKDYNNAIKYYKEAMSIKSFEGEIDYLYNIWLSYYNLKDYSSASTFFQKAIDIDPTFHNYYVLYWNAHSLYFQWEKVNALRNITQYVENIKDNKQAWWLMYYSAKESWKENNALMAITQLWKIDPSEKTFNIQREYYQQVEWCWISWDFNTDEWLVFYTRNCSGYFDVDPFTSEKFCTIEEAKFYGYKQSNTCN